MEGTQMEKLQQQYEQMLRLRKDNTILTGFKFQTMAGDIRITNRRSVLLMLDYYIKELQDELIHEKE